MPSSPPENGNERQGLIAAITAYTFWGVFPVYFLILDVVSAREVLAHRIVWAVPFGALILLLRKQWPQVRAAIKNPNVIFWLMCSALAVSINWLVYIWAVQNGHIFEASLGYYINPLMYVLAGVVLMGERLRHLQLFAVALAVIGVSIMTIYGGKFPILSLTLATTFTIYGLLRKKVDVGAMPGLFLETLWLFPFALTYLFWIFQSGNLVYGSNVYQTAWLTAAGPLTIFPLLFFAIAARNLPLSIIGFLQFIGPTIQFFVGLINGEVFTRAHAWCFGFIWCAVAIFIFDMWQRSRKT